jgi:hypothetical protein
MKKRTEGKVDSTVATSEASDSSVVVSKAPDSLRVKLRSKRFLIGAAIAVVVLLVAGTSVFVLHKHNVKNPESDAQLRLAQAKAPPPDNVAKDTYYYSKLGSTYEENNDDKDALAAYEKADSLITAQERQGGYDLNLKLAQLYAQDGQKDKAKEYYQREIDVLSKGQFAADNKSLINSLKKKKDAL